MVLGQNGYLIGTDLLADIPVSGDPSAPTMLIFPARIRLPIVSHITVTYPVFLKLLTAR